MPTLMTTFAAIRGSALALWRWIGAQNHREEKRRAAMTDDEYADDAADRSW